MTVMWATQAYDTSRVEYHHGDRQDLQTVEGTTMKLEATNEQGLKYLHHVTLTDLTPKTKYFYNVRGRRTTVVKIRNNKSHTQDKILLQCPRYAF